MLTAIIKGEKQAALHSGERGACPGCNAEVIARCGAVVTWHWAHRPGAECDSWGEPEGEWHRTWKNAVSGGVKHRTEVRFEADGTWHLADALAGDGSVVEFQHSPLPTDAVREREDFYTRMAGRMLWVFDYTFSRQQRRYSIESGPPRRFLSRDARIDAARCLCLIDLGGHVVGLVPGTRAVFGGWPTSTVQRSLLLADGMIEEVLRDHLERRRVEEEERQRLEQRRRAAECARAEAQRRQETQRRAAERAREHEEQRRRLNAARALARHYRGGAFLLDAEAYLAGSEFVRILELFLIRHGKVSLPDAEILLQGGREPSPQDFPLIGLISVQDFERPTQERAWFLLRYLDASSKELLKVEGLRRRERAATETAHAHPLLAKLREARVRGDLSAVTRLLSEAPPEVRRVFYE